MKTCQAGHVMHERLMVDTVVGKMMVFDFEKYKDQHGLYCTGQDDISRTLKNEGVWGHTETKMIEELLAQGNPVQRIVLDFGAHIGYYSVMAAKLGYTVQAYEGNFENAELLRINAKLNGVDYKIVTNTIWIDKNSSNVNFNKEIELAKIDLEGNEKHAVRMLWPLIKTQQIKHIFMEVSPVFNDSYPDLVTSICAAGYDVFLDGEPFNGEFNFAQDNLLFVRREK